VLKIEQQLDLKYSLCMTFMTFHRNAKELTVTVAYKVG